MMLRLCLVLMGCVSLLGVVFPAQASAQFGGGSLGGGWYPDNYAASDYHSPPIGLDLGVPSKKGKPILSRPCDPMMTTQREAELLAILARENPFDWSQETPLSKVAEAISTLAPVRIDERALEEIGLDKDPRVVDRTRHASVSTSKPKEASAKWWRANNSRDKAGPRRPLGAVLEDMFSDLDLTFDIRGGEFVFTTFEATEDNAPVRIYDVRPIVQPRQTADLGFREFDTIVNLIQTNVMPDSWEALGGMSTMTVYSVHGHDWMIVTAPTVVHLRIQTLLDELNR